MIQLKSAIQETESHCGPAVLAMLLSFHGIEVSQAEIVSAAGIPDRILEHGSRPAELARAVFQLAPDLKFWYKQPTQQEDLDFLINTLQVPVAVDWQGLFHASVEEEGGLNRSGDNGHYSVVVAIDLDKQQITLADPYPDFAGQLRTFSLEWFVSRWWDVARDVDELTGEKKVLRTKRFMFVLVPAQTVIPDKLGLLSAAELDRLYQKKRSYISRLF